MFILLLIYRGKNVLDRHFLERYAPAALDDRSDENVGALHVMINLAGAHI